MTFKLKAISTIIIIFFILVSPAAALEKSKFFPALLIISGVGLKFGSVYLETQANEAYDNYLHTALQADMEKYTNEYDNKHIQSIMASRIGAGFWGFAVFISIYRQLHSVSVEKSGNTELKMPVCRNFKVRRLSDVLEVYGRNGDALFAISRRF